MSETVQTIQNVTRRTLELFNDNKAGKFREHWIRFLEGLAKDRITFPHDEVFAPYFSRFALPILAKTMRGSEKDLLRKAFQLEEDGALVYPNYQSLKDATYSGQQLVRPGKDPALAAEAYMSRDLATLCLRLGIALPPVSGQDPSSIHTRYLMGYHREVIKDAPPALLQGVLHRNPNAVQDWHVRLNGSRTFTAAPISSLAEPEPVAVQQPLVLATPLPLSFEPEWLALKKKPKEATLTPNEVVTWACYLKEMRAQKGDEWFVQQGIKLNANHWRQINGWGGTTSNGADTANGAHHDTEPAHDYRELPSKLLAIARNPAQASLVNNHSSQALEAVQMMKVLPPDQLLALLNVGIRPDSTAQR